MPGPVFEGSFVLAVVTVYLLLLFGVGYLGERKFDALCARGLDRYVYVFSAGVYCTSWTFYGCIGNAAQTGPSFLALFIGPSVFALAWWTVLRKLVRFCRTHNVTSVPDLLSVRYGGTPWLGALATLFLVIGSVPYISLQLRAVSISYDTIAGSPGGGMAAVVDPVLLVALFLAAFALFFGGRYLDFTRPQGGVLTAVATESAIKLVILLAAGAFVCYGVFDGMGDIYSRVLANPEWKRLTGLSDAAGNGYARWTAYFAVAVIDVFLLPRQFHLFVVQNSDESHIKTAMWMFPLYLLLINLFIIPIAFGGLLLGLPAAAGDKFILAIPMLEGNRAMSLLVFLGGFSAATAMIVVSSVALGKMVANNLVIPGILWARKGFHGYGYLLAATRASMLAVILLGYLYARLMSYNAALMEIGIISFVAVAQFGPAVFGGLYWKGGTAGGAALGICAGFAAWFYTMILPAAVKAGFLDPLILAHGPFGVALLRPTDFLGAGIGDPVGNAVFWSLFLNLIAFVAGSLLVVPRLGRVRGEGRRPDAPGVGPRRETPDGGAHYPSLEDIEEVVTRYAGREKEREVGEVVREIREIKSRGETREAVIRQMELPVRLERILTGSIGSIAARNVLRDMLPIALADAKTLVASFREMEKDLATTRETVSHKEEEILARERLLASVVHSIDDGIVAFDAKGRITAVNEGSCRLFRRAESAMIGGDFQLLILDTPYREKQRIVARATYRNGHWRGEVEIVRGDGTHAPGLVSTARITAKGGGAAGFVASFKDLTELKAMQNKMIQSEKLASLGQMAAGVAHEIRTPLGSIKMSTRLLGDGTADAAEVIGTIREAVSSMEVIVNELLEYTREIALHLDEYDLVKITRSAVFGLEEEAGRRGVSVGVSAPPVACTALVDGVRVKQVLTNIVKNAVEAAPDRDGKVLVTLSERDGGVLITVEDNGPGMNGEELGKVFQPFYTNKAQGVGLGMPIVKRLVELHGGEVRIDSWTGRGTTVSVDLPRYPFAGTERSR
jgi:PAS domain S-box-containing protein